MDENHPGHPEYWSSRYQNAQTPWDFAGVPENLNQFLQPKSKSAHPTDRGRILIPGCGSGYEIKAFAEAGFEVTAIDFAPAAVKRAQDFVGPALADRVLLGDFFRYDFPTAAFDYIYERTFVCSLLPEQRPAYRDRVAQLLKYRGILLGYFYYQEPVLAAGPPFGFAWGTADDLFARYFLLGKDVAVNDSLPTFAGRERWQEWHRTSFNG